MQASYKPTPKQTEALRLLGGNARHVMLFGGSRSGKTFILVRALILRALAAKGSRHAVLRFRFNHVKASIVYDTFPKVMRVCFPEIDYKLDKTDWFVEFPNGAQIWFGGLDDKERTEKILGQEYATIYLNESSQIPYGSRNMAVTRLAQKVDSEVGDETKPLRLKFYYDCNPPSQAHWSYKLFISKRDPDTNQPLSDPENYVSLLMNPSDNAENLPDSYMETLNGLPARLRLRFLEGKFADLTEGALFNLEVLDKWRTTNKLPDMQRIVIAIDPSGSGDEDNASNDEIGICVAGLGINGVAYILEDLTLKAGPSVWGNVATTAYDRHAADLIVGENNFGGAMVEHVIKTCRKNTPYRSVTASRGKAVRAEPISSLVERGDVRLAGNFPELEDELCAFTTRGYMGEKSPNRADAMIWAVTELFPGVVNKPDKEWSKPLKINTRYIV